MLEVRDYLRDLGERRCSREVPSVTIADIVGEDEVEGLREDSLAIIGDWRISAYLAQQLVDVPVVL